MAHTSPPGGGGICRPSRRLTTSPPPGLTLFGTELWSPKVHTYVDCFGQLSSDGATQEHHPLFDSFSGFLVGECFAACINGFRFLRTLTDAAHSAVDSNLIAPGVHSAGFMRGKFEVSPIGFRSSTKAKALRFSVDGYATKVSPIPRASMLQSIDPCRPYVIARASQMRVSLLSPGRIWGGGNNAWGRGRIRTKPGEGICWSLRDRCLGERVGERFVE